MWYFTKRGDNFACIFGHLPISFAMKDVRTTGYDVTRKGSPVDACSHANTLHTAVAAFRGQPQAAIGSPMQNTGEVRMLRWAGHIVRMWGWGTTVIQKSRGKSLLKADTWRSLMLRNIRMSSSSS